VVGIVGHRSSHLKQIAYVSKRSENLEETNMPWAELFPIATPFP
jgi:hypothetical protein